MKQKSNELTQSNFTGEYNYHSNIDYDIISINISSAKVIFHEFVNKKPSAGLALSLFGIALSAVIAVLTANFRDIFNIVNSSYYLKAGFIIISIISGILGCIFTYKYFKDKKHFSCDCFIEKLMGIDEKNKK